MLTNTQVDVDRVLEHFGIKGMKWGVRKQRSQSDRERSAQKHTDKANDFQKRIDGLNARSPRTFYGRNQVKNQVHTLTVYRDKALKDAEAKRQGKLTDAERKTAKGVEVVGVLATAKGVKNRLESGQFHSSAVRGKAYIHGQSSMYFKKNAKLAEKDMSVEDLKSKVVKQVNPDYGQLGSKMNCRRCTLAYEMRRRGFEVRATRTTNGKGQEFTGLYNAMSPGEKVVKKSDLYKETFKAMRKAKKEGKGDVELDGPFGKATQEFSKNQIPNARIFNELSKHPDGARGELQMLWTAGGGHSVAWEIVHGKPVILDCQSGEIMRSMSDMDRVYKEAGGTAGINSATVTRLDNVAMNHRFLTRWLADAA